MSGTRFVARPLILNRALRLQRTPARRPTPEIHTPLSSNELLWPRVADDQPGPPRVPMNWRIQRALVPA